MTTSWPALRPESTSISAPPVMPVETGANRARSRPLASFSTIKTPCTGASFAPADEEGADAAWTPPLDLLCSGAYRVSAWMGRARTSFLWAVVILAVVEKPGRNSFEGVSRVTTTLKSLASSVPLVDCRVACR